MEGVKNKIKNIYVLIYDIFNVSYLVHCQITNNQLYNAYVSHLPHCQAFHKKNKKQKYHILM